MLAQPLRLPCGLQLPNRILKSAMSEHLGNVVTGDPTHDLVRLYARWARGGAGTLVTGHIMVDRSQLEDPSNVVADEASDIVELARCTEAVHDYGARLIAQINHPGRQTPRTGSLHPVAPSAVAALEPHWYFAPPRELTGEEVGALVERFAVAAAVLERAGFDGVQVHAAHGYLVGEFLSPAVNQRTDEWGGDLDGRSRFLREILSAIRARVAPSFAVLVKVNVSDFRPGGFDAEDSARLVAGLGDEGVDLVELSGGTNEHPEGLMHGMGREPETEADAYFASFAPRMRAVTDVPLALTGGLRSRSVMERLVADGTVDVVGLARPLVVRPELPRDLLSGQADSVTLRPPAMPGSGRTAGMLELGWYMAQFRRLARGQQLDPGYPAWRSVLGTLGRSASVPLQRTAATVRRTASRAH